MRVGSLDENPNCYNAHASFRLVGDDLDPDAVTAALGLTPDSAHVKGDPNPHTRGETRFGAGHWSLSSEARLQSTSLERHLVVLLDMLEPVASSLAEVRAEQGLAADFFCFFGTNGHGGPIISPSAMGRMAALDAPLGLDIYGK